MFNFPGAWHMEYLLLGKGPAVLMFAMGSCLVFSGFAKNHNAKSLNLGNPHSGPTCGPSPVVETKKESSSSTSMPRPPVTGINKL